MKPKKTNHSQDRLFEQRLSELLNPNHELMVMSRLINWNSLETHLEYYFSEEEGAPAKPVRLMTGIMLLQQMYGLSDEAVVRGWVENPYWQLFCGYDYLQWKFPIHPTTLVKWRKKIGTEGIEKVVSLLIDSALRVGLVDKKSLERTLCDTTVMPKAVTYPTDAKLYYNCIVELNRFATSHKIKLRQSYRYIAKKTLRKVGQYSHSRKQKKAGKELKRLKVYLGRLFRDVLRQLEGDAELEKRAAPVISTIGRILMQERQDSHKIYSLHEPHVECISKGKAHKKYEFGCKASLVVTEKEGFVLSCEAIHGNPYDGHTLERSLANASINSGVLVKEVLVDKGYRGHGVKCCKVLIAGAKKKAKMHWRKWKRLQRRQSIEPHIGHMKSEGKLGRNFLRGKTGDQINAILCGIGHNMRLLMNHIRNKVLVPTRV